MAITTIVIMVVAIISPVDGRIQPLLRFIDTVVGIAVGVVCQWAASICIGPIRGSRMSEDRSWA